MAALGRAEIAYLRWWEAGFRSIKLVVWRSFGSFARGDVSMMTLGMEDLISG